MSFSEQTYMATKLVYKIYYLYIIIKKNKKSRENFIILIKVFITTKKATFQSISK